MKFKDLIEIEEGYNLIGEDCINIINEYVEQLKITEKYNRCIQEMKDKVYHNMISNNFSMLNFNNTQYHYYQGNDGYLMMIRYMNEGIYVNDYLINRNIEIVYLFV